MKVFSVIGLVMLSHITLAQLRVTKLTKTDVPASIHYVGHVLEVINYTDIEGEHLVFTTETGVTASKKTDGIDGLREAEINAYNYVIGSNTPKLIWKVHDFVAPCPVEVLLNYVPNTFAVTDLDNDGKAEVWLMYKAACNGDVAPLVMKVIMYQSTKKYAMRGETKTQTMNNPVHYGGSGTYTFDAAFKTGPDAFRQYAEALWKKNYLEKW